MKTPVGLLLVLAAVSPLQSNAETMETLKTRDGREYTKVEIVAKDDVGLRIRHESGTTRIAFADLPDDVQAKYKHDPAKAAARKAEESKALQEYERSQAPAPQPPAKKPSAPQAAAPEEKGLTADPPPPAGDHEAEKLAVYIADMKERSKDATARATSLRADAAKERSRTRFARQHYDSVRPERVPDKSGYAKAARMEEEAKALERQVIRAEALIAEAQERYYRLMGVATPEATE